MICVSTPPGLAVRALASTVVDVASRSVRAARLRRSRPAAHRLQARVASAHAHPNACANADPRGRRGCGGRRCCRQDPQLVVRFDHACRSERRKETAELSSEQQAAETGEDTQPSAQCSRRSTCRASAARPSALLGEIGRRWKKVRRTPAGHSRPVAVSAGAVHVKTFLSPRKTGETTSGSAHHCSCQKSLPATPR